MAYIPVDDPKESPSGWNFHVGKNYAGSGYKHRVEFFSRFMPHSFAIRAARRWNLTPGKEHYNANIMNGITDLDYNINLIHTKHLTWDRDKVVDYVWLNLKRAYISRGIDVSKSGYLFRNWVHDWAPS